MDGVVPRLLRRDPLFPGGRGKGEDYAPLAEAASIHRVKAVILLGEEAEAIGAALDLSVPVISVGSGADGRTSMREAVREAESVAAQGDAVLLAPACASFDMFANYAERGKAFQEAVLAGTP